MRVHAPSLVVSGCVVLAAGFAIYYAARTTTFAVMTDELQVARLAMSIAESLSPVPTIHGVYYGAHSQLYPLLLAPFYGTLSAPAAETAAHVLGAILLASAALPAYLLARSVSGSRGAGYAAAALTAFTPFLVLSATLLTENAAYPAFAWAVLACHRAIARPSPRNDAMALAGLLLAFLARTQLSVLAIALPIALVLHELGMVSARRHPLRAAAHTVGARLISKHPVLATAGALLLVFVARTQLFVLAIALPAALLFYELGAVLESRRPPRGTAARTFGARLISGHPVLVAAYGAGAVAALALALMGSLLDVVGNYGLPFRGDLIPPGFLSAAAAHFDQIAVGAGIIPAVLAASWAVTAIIRPERREAHAFAALLVVLVPLLTFEVTSFDLRFTPEQFIQDRYLFYLVPLFAVGSAAWLAQRTQRSVRVITLAGAAGAFVLLLSLASYDETIIFWASPAAAFHPALVAISEPLGLTVIAFLQFATVGLALVIGAAIWWTPRLALIGVTLAVACFGAIEAGYVFEHQVEPLMTQAVKGKRRDWIDSSLPGSPSVALVPNGYPGGQAWWEAEMWNKDVDRLLRVDAGPTDSPFPAVDLSVDWTAGALVGGQPSVYLVLSPSETRFGLRATQIANGRGLRLVRTQRPYRLDWATRGLTHDGWITRDRLGRIRLYGGGHREARSVFLTLAAPASSLSPVDFGFGGGRAFVTGRVGPGGARRHVQLRVCVPAAGHVDAWLTAIGHTRISDARVVLHVDRLVVRDAGRCVEPPSA